jgi:hypothetical protein
MRNRGLETLGKATMNKYRIVALTLFLGTAGYLFAQTAQYTRFPAAQTIQSSQWHKVAGCDCGIDPTYPEDFRKQIMVSPNSLKVSLRHKFQLRYDASAICNGQTIRDTNGVEVGKPNFAGVGTVDFDNGTVQKLPNIYGIVSYPGYTKTGAQIGSDIDSIRFDITVQCYDPRAAGAECPYPQKYQTCRRAITIPVTVKE